MQQLDTSGWVVPDFYSLDKDDYFESAVKSVALAQGLLQEETQPTEEPKNRRRKLALDNPHDGSLGDDRFAGIRRHLYGCALYATGFSIPVTFKDQKFNARFVPGHQWDSAIAGPKKSTVMVVGKMPGREEVNKHKNFIGPSGNLLKEQLRSLGVSPSDWYITNLVKFAPPDNFTGALPKHWIHMCNTLLKMELAIVQPDYILCLGSEASKEMLDITVDRAYGSVFNYAYKLDPVDGSEKAAKAIVSIHPAAVLRKADRINNFQLSLRQFKELTTGAVPKIKETDLHHTVIRTEYELEALITSILNNPPPMLAIDAEWYGRRPEEPGAFLRCFQFSWLPKHAAVVALTDDKGNPSFEGNPYRQFARFFTCPNPPRLVGHNIKADLMWLKKPLLAEGVDIVKAAMAPETGIDSGPMDTRFKGGFDTMLAMHSIRETGPFELEALGVLFLGVPRYDGEVHEMLAAKVPHGYMPDGVLYPYAAYDPDISLRLAYLFNGEWMGPNEHDCVKPGYLDHDPKYGINSRKSFWISMLAMPSFMEMEETGITFDTAGCMAMREDFIKARATLLAKLQADIKWPDFNPNSVNHKRELLFGEELNGKKRVPGPNGTMLPVRVRPEGAVTLGLTPLKATVKKAPPWHKIVADGLTASYSPSTAKDTLGVYGHKNETVKKLMDLGFMAQALNTALRDASPKSTIGLEDETEFDDKADEEDIPESTAQRGLLDYVCSDMAVRSLYFQTKETGRASSAKPNLMAVSKRRDKDYKRILKENLADKFRPIRSLFMARPGKLLIEADFVGAELAVMAWLSGDPLMIEHVRRSGLPESDPNHFDIHSSFAVEIFRLGLPPLKSALEKAGKKHLRDAVKCVVSGSRLHTTGGLLKVEDIVGQGLNDDEHKVYSGDLRVVNHKTSTPIIAVYNGGVKDCLRVTTEHGYRLDSSTQHWYWVMGDDGDMEFKPAKKLKVGDVVAVRIQEGPFGSNVEFPPIHVDAVTSFKDLDMPSEFNYEWAALLGLHLAEGSANPVSGSFQLALAHEDDPEFAGKTESLLRGIFGDRVRTGFIRHEEYQNQTGFYVSSVKLCRWLAKYCPGDSHTKRIPEFVYSWPKELVSVLLSWMFEGDGTVKRNGKGFTVSYSTSSEGLARDVQLLLTQFGILSDLAFETRDGYDGKYWTVTLASNESRERFCRGVKFVSASKNDRCVSEVEYRLDTRTIPGQVSRLKTILPFVSSPVKEKCRECVRSNCRVSLGVNRLKLILDNVRVSDLSPAAHEAYLVLSDLVSWDVSFQEIESIERIGKHQVYDVQTTPEYDHLVSYNGILTHQTLTFGIPYGRGIEAVIMAVKEESGIELSVEEATAIRESIFARYTRLHPFLERCKDRVIRPGYLRDPWGGNRRFDIIDDRTAIEDAKREAVNFRIQGTVARTMSMGLYYLRSYRDNIEPSADYRVVNQIHDAAIVECAAKDVDNYVKKIAPLCLSEATAFRALDDDGRPVSDVICKFDLDIHVYERWGQDLTWDDCDRLQIPRSYGKAPKKLP